ncbi:hypothetical protein [Emticicia sp. 17c]|uniref:hypothetical protein n=1 Tax=Emticicia sp. 17c TaxID=3127704 RepID=UPI00301C5109
MGKPSESKPLPNWLMLVIFLLIMTILWVFGDLFTFLLGLFIMALVFANGYDRTHADEGHH